MSTNTVTISVGLGSVCADSPSRFRAPQSGSELPLVSPVLASVAVLQAGELGPGVREDASGAAASLVHPGFNGASRERVAIHREQTAGSNARRIDDTALIRAAQQGDRAAFEELVRQYDHAVLRLALHLTGSPQDAQDVYQEAFLKAYRNIGRFRFECSFYTWLYRIVTNICLDHLRKRQVRKEESPVITSSSGEEVNLLDQVPDVRSGADPERDLMRRELGARINGALQRLSERERIVFELKHYQGLKLRTIGEMLNTTEETAKNTLFRATQKLRQALAEMK
jgi:RNA polymerase sigma-70 factor (ECF subfamily)